MYRMRVCNEGRERPVARISNTVFVGRSDRVSNSDKNFFANELDKAAAAIKTRVAHGETSHVGYMRVGAPTARPHQIIRVGLNFSDHAAESGGEAPSEPIQFSKSSNTLIGPDDGGRTPGSSIKTDWEVELGIVIRRRARYLDSETDAAIMHRGLRDLRLCPRARVSAGAAGPWMKGKSAKTSDPYGPWRVTPDEIAAVLKLSVRLDANGDRRQTGSTGIMMDPPKSHRSLLQPVHGPQSRGSHQHGHLARRGTGNETARHLKPGDTISMSIDGLRIQKQRVVQFDGKGGDGE